VFALHLDDFHLEAVGGTDSGRKHMLRDGRGGEKSNEKLVLLFFGCVCVFCFCLLVPSFYRRRHLLRNEQDGKRAVKNEKEDRAEDEEEKMTFYVCEGGWAFV
jgi:hypothetical protein